MLERKLSKWSINFFHPPRELSMLLPIRVPHGLGVIWLVISTHPTNPIRIIIVENENDLPMLPVSSHSSGMKCWYYSEGSLFWLALFLSRSIICLTLEFRLIILFYYGPSSDTGSEIIDITPAVRLSALRTPPLFFCSSIRSVWWELCGGRCFVHRCKSSRFGVRWTEFSCAMVDHSH